MKQLFWIVVLAVAAHAGDELTKPVRLRAGDELIDTGRYIAHAGPLFADYDRDGVPDLLVGNFRGHIQLYKNVGTRQAPEFESKGLMQAAGKPVLIKNW